MCSFTVSPQRARWYWHHEGNSQFTPAGVSRDENVGYCDATFAITTGTNQYVFENRPTTFLDACAAPGAVRLLAGADDVVGAVQTVPFAFNFWDVNYNQVRPTSNGYVLFGGAVNAYDNSYYPTAPLPDTNRPRPAAFLYNSDLYQRTTTGVCVATFGAAPARRFVVETQDAAMCCGDSGPAHFTFEMILNELDNSMDWVYQTVNTGGSAANFVAGTQDAAAARGTTLEFRAGGALTRIVTGTSLHVTAR
jgi:hypothetical protein